MKVAKLYGMLQPGESETAAVRAVFIIDPTDNKTDHVLSDECQDKYGGDKTYAAGFANHRETQCGLSC